MKVIDLDAYRKARERIEQRDSNWPLIGGFVFSIAMWSFIGWLTWRVFR